MKDITLMMCEFVCHVVMEYEEIDESMNMNMSISMSMIKSVRESNTICMDETKKFLAEIKLNHLNIVKFYGTVLFGGNEIGIVNSYF